MTIKKFLLLEENKKAYWKGANWLMAFGISYIAYSASDNIAWAVTALPIAKIVSEMITRYVNGAYKLLTG